MDELLHCRCGHGISQHTSSGCDGDRHRPCWCVRTRNDIIDAAVKAVRTEYQPTLVPPIMPPSA
ncbi:MAG: hypothetical protein WCE44_04640 [Candidatus Velthaea sp.]|jgi:hypothetical protein